MKRLLHLRIAALAVLFTAYSVQSAPANEADAQGDDAYFNAPPEVVDAWQDMRFGMFLCWGPVTLTGEEIGHSRDEPSWGRRPGMRGGRGPIPAEQYDRLYTRWKPENFDAEHWVGVAKEGGCRYMIFLVKHHDGFCLYDSKLTDYKSTGEASAWKVDVLGHVAEACRKQGLKLMVYYSQPDWHHPDYLGPHHDRYVEYFHGQVREILTGYGRIDGLWFDGLRPPSPESARLWDAGRVFRVARSLQPHLIINNRCGLPGDYDTPENRVGFFQVDRPWETCTTTNGQWSWKPGSPFFRSYEECIQILVSTAIGGGNLALNTGPMPDGRIEPRQVERFRQIGRWLGKYGESIYGTRGGPFVAPDEKTRPVTRGKDKHFKLASGAWWGGSTHRSNTVYLHVLRWPQETIDLADVGGRVVESSVLTGGKATVSQDERGIRVFVPDDQRDPIDTIIRLQFDGLTTLRGKAK